MYKGFISKSFLVLFLLNFAFFLIPTNVFAVTETELTGTGQCKQESNTPGFATTYDCGGSSYVCRTTVNLTSLPTRECTKQSSRACIPLPGYFSLADCFTDIANLILSKIIWVINNALLRPLLWLSSLIFDFTVYFTIVKFKTNFADLNAGGVGGLLLGNSGSSLIYYLWGMIRDFLNIIIFLTIIYSAVQSMFDSFENTRKRFISLLVFSIIANFSLLFVKIAIDVSNILALQAYTLAVKPSSTESFWQFRFKNTNTDGPASYGEYIRNSVDLDKLTSSEKTGAIAKLEIEDMQGTFMFQIGRMVVFIGVIYILLFMAGLLLTRAVVLLFAMIISPLIAADLFFGMMSKTKETEAIANGVRKITEKMKGDFYDALLKGPLLIFFVFLIGVLAESIFSQGVMNTLSESLDKMKDAKSLDGSFTKSIFVFFKFTMFLILCQFLFNALNNIKLGGVSGTRLRGYGGAFANKILGRGVAGLSRAGGALGRNTLGRAATNPNSALGRLLNRVDSSDTIAKWKSAQAGSIRSRLGNAIGGASNSLQKGTYDLRNTNLLNNKLGGVIKNATENISGFNDKNKTPKGFGINVGEAAKFGFADAIDDRAKKSQEDINKKIEEAGKDLKATAEEIKTANDNAKVKDSELSLSQIDKVLSDPNLKKQLIENPQSVPGFSSADLKILTGAAKADPEILNKIDQAREKAEKEVKKNVEKRKEAIKESIVAEVEATIKPETGFIGRNITRPGSSYTELLGDALTGNRVAVREEVAARFRKSSAKERKEDENKIKKQIDYIENDIAVSVTKTKKFIDDAKALDPTLDFSKEEKAINDFIQNIDKYTNNTENSDGVDEFNKTVDGLFKAKRDALGKTTKLAMQKGNNKLMTESAGLAKKLRGIEESYGKVKPKKEDSKEKEGDKTDNTESKEDKPAEDKKDDH